MKGCTCKGCSPYTAPEVLCKGALLALYIETVRKLRRLEGDEV